MSLSPLLLSLKSPPPSVVRFTPVVRFILVLIASTTEEKTPFSTRADCAAWPYSTNELTSQQGNRMIQLMSNYASVAFGPTGTANGTMGHCVHSFHVHFNSYATPEPKYSRIIILVDGPPGPQKTRQFSRGIIWAQTSMPLSTYSTYVYMHCTN